MKRLLIYGVIIVGAGIYFSSIIIVQIKVPPQSSLVVSTRFKPCSGLT